MVAADVAPQSPALAAALRAVRAAVEDEVKGTSPKAAGNGDEIIDDLKEQIATLQKKLAEANTAREAAEEKLASVADAAKGSEAQINPISNLCGAAMKCLGVQSEEERAAALAARREELRISLQPEVQKKIITLINRGTATKIRSASDNTTLNELGIDSLAMTSMNKLIADGLGVTVEVLEKKVPITETTTAAELIEALTAIGLEHEINEQLASTSGSRAGVDSAAADDRDDTAPTAPASAPVAKVSAAELLEEAGLAHLTEAALGDWAECKRVAAEGRQALLTFLKANGVSKLPERQKLASALAKAHRDERL